MPAYRRQILGIHGERKKTDIPRLRRQRMRIDADDDEIVPEVFLRGLTNKNKQKYPLERPNSI
jgi:hypothetical protein